MGAESSELRGLSDLERSPNYVTLRITAGYNGPRTDVPRVAAFDFSWDLDGGQKAYDLADAAAAFLRQRLPEHRMGVQWIRNETATYE